MLNAMHVINIILVVSCLLVDFSHGKEKEKFDSIGGMNRDLGKRVLGLEDAFGPSVKLMRSATKIQAVLLGEVEDVGVERYLGFPLKGKFIDVDKKAASVILSEDNVGVWPLGLRQPRFALIYFGRKAEDKVVLLIVPPEKIDESATWTVSECSSDIKSYLLPAVTPLLSKILKALNETQKQVPK